MLCATFVAMSGGEIILILFIYLLLFGAKGVPALAQTMGKAIYQFRNATKDVQNEIMKSASEIRKQTNIKLDQLDIDSTPITPKTSSHPIAPPTTSSPDQTVPSTPDTSEPKQ